MQFTPYVLPVAASAILLTALAPIAWRLRPAPGAVSFCLLMLATAEWSVGYALELTSHTLSSALFWDNVTWIGAVAAPTLWLVFALYYAGRAKWLTNRYLPFLAVEPIVMLVLVWMNGTHGPVEQVSLNTIGPFPALAITYSLWYWINIAYSYTLLFFGAFTLASYILTAARSSHLYSVQGACLLLAVAAPWLGNFLTISGLNPLPYLNLTPFAFFISALAFWVGLFIFRLLDVVPIAREVVIEHMREAAIVLDTHNRVVDLNPPAQRLSNWRSDKAVGRPFDEVFQQWPELVQHCQNPKEIDEEVIAGVGEGPSYFGLHATPLYHRNGHPAVTGRLIVLHDITERIEAEMALKESEGRFRSIFEEVPIGIAVVDLLNGQLLQVNKAFCEMLGYSELALLRLSLPAITHADDVDKDVLLSEQASRGEITSYKVEKRFLKKNGETLWTDLTATILRNHRGHPIFGLVMLENIIERKRAKLLEEERHLVAYELHDGLAQVAVSAHQHLQALASHYHPRSLQARQELDRALELAQRSVREARRLIAGLRPTVLDDFGLATALRLQIEAQRNDGWTIEFDEALGPQRLPPAIETTIFGVAQEALTNVRKHAQTKRARLALERRGTNIHLEVQDWGCGFEPGALPRMYSPGEHVGLRGMQERLELVGGHLMLSSQPGAGTVVVAEVPVLTSNERTPGDDFNPAGNEAAPLMHRSHPAQRNNYNGQ